MAGSSDDEGPDLGRLLFDALFGRGAEDAELRLVLDKTCLLLGALAARQGGRVEVDLTEMEDMHGKGVAIQYLAATRRVVVQVVRAGQAPQSTVEAPSTDSKH